MPKVGSWRPENPYLMDIRHSKTRNIAVIDAFEAGVDATLEKLMRMARESPTGTFEIDSKIVNMYVREKKK